jgi:microcystin-dependent protein
VEAIFNSEYPENRSTPGASLGKTIQDSKEDRVAEIRTFSEEQKQIFKIVQPTFGFNEARFQAFPDFDSAMQMRKERLRKTIKEQSGGAAGELREVSERSHSHSASGAGLGKTMIHEEQTHSKFSFKEATQMQAEGSGKTIKEQSPGLEGATTSRVAAYCP